VTISCVSLLIKLGFIGMFVYYFNEFNPLSRSPYASPSTLLKLLSTLRM